ncbi:ankyrin repeat domain 34Bb [Aplochiton taeniatus]
MEEALEVRTDGNSLLKAVYLSRLRLTRLLLEGGSYINESNERGETPLMVACKTQHADQQSVPKHKMVKYLLENGADPNIQDKTGKTALMHGCLEQAGPQVLSLLLASGADPSLEDHGGSSALVYAINAGDKEVLRVLLDACKAKGKEVIIITTDKLPSGRQMTKQYLNVPPAPDLDERLHHTPTPCCPSDLQLRTPPQGSSADASPQPGSPLLGIREHHLGGPGSGAGSDNSQPGSPTRGVAKLLHLQRLHSEPWLKIPPSLLQHSQSESLTEEQRDISAQEDEELAARLWGLSHGRAPPTLARHHSVDVKDATGLLRALEQGGKRGLGRKMSYDSAATAVSPHSASHPNLLRGGDRGGGGPAHQEPHPHHPLLPECLLPHLAVSSLRNVVRRRNIGMDHYSSDSQLPQFNSSDSQLPQFNSSEDSGRAAGCVGVPEKRKLVTSRSSTLSGSRESLDSITQRRGAAGGLERRGSGALLLDHIAHTRPGYLPPLNPHAPIPDIRASPGSSCSLSGSTKALNGAQAPGPKPLVPLAPAFPRDLKAKKTLLRRHSMQTEQLKQLGNFEELFGQ